MRCTVQTIIPEAQWGFDMRIDVDPLVWTAKKSASELFRSQERLFTPPGRAVTRRTTQLPDLGFYEPNLVWTVEEAPTRIYTKTIDNRFCAQMPKVTLVLHISPEVQLANELQERTCVSRAAFNHQLEHDKALRDTLPELKAAQQKFKDAIYPIYSTQGAAGSTMYQMNQGAKLMERLAGQTANDIYEPFMLERRRRVAETPQIQAALAGMCQGQFGDIAARAVSGKPIEKEKPEDDKK